MKTKVVLTLLVLSLFTQSLSSQITGGFKNGQSTPGEVMPSAITAGGVSGDVNLFSGTYQSGYSLGSVSTESGLSFALNLSYASTYSSGDNLPHSSGIPYGEGWNLDIPTISVSVEDYKRYLLLEDVKIGTCNENGITKKYYVYDEELERDVNHADDEGDLFWYAPTLNIPGVASGRLVYKYEKQGQYVFVLNTFERYVEAYFDGVRWEVVLDDGTRYELGAAMVSHRKASNQRVERDCYSDFTTANLVLPKTEILSWNCVRIYNRNMVGNIRFTYESFGKFDFYKVLAIKEQPRNFIVLRDQWKKRAPMRAAAKEVILKEVRATVERLILNYESIPITGGSDLLDINAPGVYRTDSMYAYTSVHHEGGNDGTDFANWKRYRHNRSHSWGTKPSFVDATNPYVGKTGAGIEGYHFEEADNEGNGYDKLTFEDGFLESSRFAYDALIPGELYEIKTRIDAPQSINGNGGCLFDINLASGDPVDSTFYNNGYLSDGSQYLLSDYYNTSRGQSIFSTFQDHFKWNTFATEQAGTGGDPKDLETSNYFVMPNLP